MKDGKRKAFETLGNVCKKLAQNTVGRSVPVTMYEVEIPECLKKNR